MEINKNEKQTWDWKDAHEAVSFSNQTKRREIGGGISEQDCCFLDIDASNIDVNSLLCVVLILNFACHH